MSTMTRTAYDLDTPREAPWTERAACQGMDTEAFALPPIVGSAYDEAHATCRRCPVQRDCLSMAIETRSWGLIFGGVDFSEPATGATLLSKRCAHCLRTFETFNVRARYCCARCRTYSSKQRRA